MASRYIEYFGDPDISYLRDALARASINIVPQSLLVKPLLDGRTAATVEKLITNNENYVRLVILCVAILCGRIIIISILVLIIAVIISIINMIIIIC